MLDAVLPLIENDVHRSELLRESLRRFGGDLGTCWVVSPDEQVARIAAVFASDERWTVVAESEVLGAPPRGVPLPPSRLRPRRMGWYFQQVLKLAGSARSTADFCLTLDADVIALREITHEAVAPGGRAWSQIEPPPQAHPHWYDGAAKLLGLPRSEWHNAVTPALLCPVACRDLIALLETRKGRLDRDWVDLLMRRTPWSEYALYHTFLEGTGRFDDHHVRVRRPVLYGDPVWYAEDFDRWQAGRTRGSPLFTLVQSNTGITVERIWERLTAAGG